MILKSLLFLLPAAVLFAADPAFSEKGNLLLKEDFSAATLNKAWAGKPGTWEIVDGAAKISEVAADKHAAVRRRALAYHDARVEFSFRFDGAKMIALSINNKGGHVCRLTITPKNLVLQTDQPNAKSELKQERLAVQNAAVDPGKWHQVVVEVRGKRILAQLDGGKIVSGESDRIDVDKTDVGFPVAGVSATIDNIAVYALR